MAEVVVMDSVVVVMVVDSVVMAEAATEDSGVADLGSAEVAKKCTSLTKSQLGLHWEGVADLKPPAVATVAVATVASATVAVVVAAAVKVVVVAVEMVKVAVTRPQLKLGQQIGRLRPTASPLFRSMTL